MQRVGAAFILVLILTIWGAGCASEPEIDGKKISQWLVLLRSDDWNDRTRAQDTLARLGPDSIPYLKRLVNAKDHTLRRSVILTPAKLGPAAREMVPDLLRRMKLEEVDIIRAELLKALTAIDPRAPGVPEEFKKRLRDRAEEVKEAARQGLASLEAPKPVPEKEKKPKEKPPREENLILREAVAAQIKDKELAFGLVAEVVRLNRRAAIIWPAIKAGKLLDDDIVAYVFERQGDSWQSVGENTKLSQGQGPQKLAGLSGGADKQRVVRPCGVARGELPGYLEERATVFKTALEAGKAEEAIGAYEALTRAFSFRLVAYDDMLPEMLINESMVSPPWKFNPSEDASTHPVEIQVKDKAIKGHMRLGPCGDGYVIADLKEQ